MKNKSTALITGATSGIGKELALIHASRGDNLIIVARKVDDLEAVKKEIQAKHKVDVFCIAQDLAEVDAADKVFQAVQAEGLQVEYLINNAGMGGQGVFHERSWKKEETMINLNVLTPTALAHKFLPEMVKRNSGRILNVASSAALVPGGPLQSVYYATKAFLLSLSQGIAGELADTKVTVTALLPGATKTNFSSAADLDKTKLFEGAVFTPDTVAQDGYEAMMKGELCRTTALTFSNKVTMKMVPFLPTKMILSQIKEMQEV